MQQSIYQREEAKEYWQGLKQKKLCIQRCQTCDEYVFYPRQYCPNDLGELAYEEVSGKGKIIAYTVVERTAHPALINKTPFVLAVIKLKEGATILSRLVDNSASEELFNKEVEVVFDEVSSELTLPLFKIS